MCALSFYFFSSTIPFQFIGKNAYTQKAFYCCWLLITPSCNSTGLVVFLSKFYPFSLLPSSPLPPFRFRCFLFSSEAMLHFILGKFSLCWYLTYNNWSQLFTHINFWLQSCYLTYCSLHKCMIRNCAIDTNFLMNSPFVWDQWPLLFAQPLFGSVTNKFRIDYSQRLNENLCISRMTRQSAIQNNWSQHS